MAAWIARTAARTLGAAAALTAGMTVARALIARSRWYDLAGRSVLITGGSRGLGLVLARRLTALDCRVAICARDEDELARARHDLDNRGGEVLPIVCDLTDPEGARRMVRDVLARFAHIDVLVNNAGEVTVGPWQDMAERDYRRAMDIHFWAALYVTTEVLPQMRRLGEGRIVNISSIGGKVPVPHLAPYCASKFAVAGWSGALRAELMRDNVFVTTVYPWLMRTGSHVQARFKGQHEKEYTWFKWSLALPGSALAAEHAADRILLAAARGEAEVLVGPQAFLAAKAHSLVPEWSSDGLAVMNRLLPRSSLVGTPGERHKGFESESSRTNWGPARALDRQALDKNELG